MAYSTNKTDVNRTTSGITLPAEISAEVWAKAEEQSAIMQLAQRIDLPGSGISIPVITGDPVAAFTVESTEKQVSKASFNTKTMTPYKIAVIELFSNEFRRDLPALYDEIIRRSPAAIGRKFDDTVFAGPAPGTGFDTLASATAVSLVPAKGDTVYTQLVDALLAVGAADGTLNGWALSAQAQAKLLAAVDNSGRPLFIDSANDEGAIGRVLGAPVVRAQSAYRAEHGVLGFAGDWTQARYGIVGGIDVGLSDQATINDGANQVNLWQRNMFAVRIEAEVGFVVSDLNCFVKLTEDAGSE